MSQSGIWYLVGTRFVADDSQATKAGERMDRTFGGVTNRVNGLLKSLVGLAAGYVGLRASIGWISEMARQHGSLEDSIRGMAATINNNFRFPEDQWGSAMTSARWMVRGLAEDASRLPGELRDFISIAWEAGGPMMAMGVEVREIRENTGMIAQLAGAWGLNMQQAGSDVARILMGQAGMQTMLWRSLSAQRLLTQSAEEFNALAPEERYALLMGAIRRVAGDQSLAAETARAWNTQISTLSDNLRGPVGLLGQVRERIMPTLLDQVRRFNDEWERSGDRVASLANAIARTLNPLIERTGDMARGAWAERERLGQTLGGAAVGYAGYRAVAYAGGGGIIANMLIRMREGPGYAAALLPRLHGVAPGLATGLAGLTPLLAPLKVGLLLILPAVLAVAGVLMVLKRNMMGLGDYLGGAFSGLLSEGGLLLRNLWAVAQPLAATLGVMTSAGLIPLMMALTGLIKIVNLVMESLGKLWTFVSSLIGAYSVGNFSQGHVVALDAAKRFSLEGMMGDLEQAMKVMGFERPELGPGTYEAGKNLPVGKHVTNINGPITIEQKFDRDVSPDRIAFGVLDELVKLRYRMADGV